MKEKQKGIKQIRISPYFSEKQIKKIDSKIGEIGVSRADVVKNIVILYFYPFRTKKKPKNTPKK